MSDMPDFSICRQGVSLDEMLDGLPERPDAHCKACWDWFDNNFDGETSSISIKFAQLGWSAKQIFLHIMRFWPASTPLTDPAKEYLALSIEYVVRLEKVGYGQ